MVDVGSEFDKAVHFSGKRGPSDGVWVRLRCQRT